MVATMACITEASAAEQLAFITGRATIDPACIQPELWASILFAGLKLLPLEQLTEQMCSLRQILGRHSTLWALAYYGDSGRSCPTTKTGSKLSCDGSLKVNESSKTC